MSDITFAEIEKLVEEGNKLKDEIKNIEKDLLDPLKAKLRDIDNKILGVLEDHELTSFKTKHGTVIRNRRFSVQTPKTMEQKKDFFQWLHGKGEEVYWSYATINSQSLNGLYKQELEIAKEKGDFDFKIPGLGEPTAHEYLTRRKS